MTRIRKTSSAGAVTGTAILGFVLCAAASSAASAGTRAVRAVSPSAKDGLIAYVGWRPRTSDAGFLDNREIFVIGANGAGERRLTRNAFDDYGPAWSPDGKRLLFYRGPLPLNAGNSGLYLMNADGTHQRRLLLDRANDDHDDLGVAAWSPDGKKIAFERDYQIYVMKADGSGERRLTRCESSCASYPAWSPDGRRIAYVNVNSGIYVMNADGSKGRKLVDIFGLWDLAWSPDGTKLLFSRSIGCCNSEIYVVNADGTRLRNVTRNPAGDFSPAWSPDGRSIVFVRHRIGFERRAIHVMGADGSGQLDLGRDSSIDSSPAWSPDGRIAFARDGRIHVMKPDGSGLRKVTDGRFEDDSPTWQPRRKQLIRRRLWHWRVTARLLKCPSP